MGKKSREKLEKRQGNGWPARNASLRLRSEAGGEKAFIFIIRWGTYLVLFTPLIISTAFFFPFVAPKTAFFRIVVEIMLAAYLFLVLMNRKYRPKINHLTIAIFLFMAVFIISSFAGINFSRSFWSTYERMTGIFTMLHLLAFFVILTSVFKKREDWEKFFGVSIIVGVVLSFYILHGNEISTRGGGTIGNTSFMAAYLLFDIFFAIIFLFANLFRKNESPYWQARIGISYFLVVIAFLAVNLIYGTPNWFFWLCSIIVAAIMVLVLSIGRRVYSSFWKIFAAASLIPMLLVFFTSTARGAIASFFMALFLMFLGYLIFSGRKVLKRAAFAIIILSVAGTIFLAAVQPPAVRGAGQNLMSEMNSRFVVWETGWKGFLEKPIFGWGPENFNAVFLKHFNSCMSLPECGAEVWFDRVHNIVFDVLVTTGIFGLLSYLSIFAIAIYGLVKIAPRAAEKSNTFVPLGLAVLLVAYFAQNMLVFDMINSYLVFFLSLGFASFLISQKQEEEEAGTAVRNRPVNFVFALTVIGLTVFLVWPANIGTLAANRYVVKMVGSNNIYEAVDFFRGSLSSWMEGYEAREQFAQRLIKSSYQLTDLSGEEKGVFIDVYQVAEEEMEKSIQENSLDFRHHLFAGELYTGSFRISRNPEKIQRAEEILRKAIELSPTNQQGWWQLAEASVSQGKTSQAIPYLEKAVEINPKVGRAHWYLAMGYRIMGEYELALEEIKLALNNNYDWVNDSDYLNTVLEILNIVGVDFYSYFADYDEMMVESLLKLTQREPDNSNFWMFLAAGYANLGQYDKARAAAQEAINADPSIASKANEFMKSLPLAE